MLKYILAWMFVKSIFDNTKAYSWNDGKAFFKLDENVLKALFPKEYLEAKERAEGEDNV